MFGGLLGRGLVNAYMEGMVQQIADCKEGEQQVRQLQSRFTCIGMLKQALAR